MSSKKGAWSPDEVDQLLKLQASLGNQWAEIARTMGNGRNGQQCLIRFNNQTKPGINKTPWSDAEDSRLQMLKTRGGTWPKIASDIGNGRTAKQCHERWNNYLDPDRKTNAWDSDEDIVLEQKYAELNGKFGAIRKFLPGRSFNDCQNHFFILHPDRAPKTDRRCGHGNPSRRCRKCHGYDICEHCVTRDWCHLCRGKLWRRELINSRITYMQQHPAKLLIARVKKFLL
jgi:hypothetical protein